VRGAFGSPLQVPTWQAVAGAGLHCPGVAGAAGSPVGDRLAALVEITADGRLLLPLAPAAGAAAAAALGAAGGSAARAAAPAPGRAGQAAWSVPARERRAGEGAGAAGGALGPALAPPAAGAARAAETAPSSGTPAAGADPQGAQRSAERVQWGHEAAGQGHGAPEQGLGAPGAPAAGAAEEARLLAAAAAFAARAQVGALVADWDLAAGGQVRAPPYHASACAEPGWHGRADALAGQQSSILQVRPCGTGVPPTKLSEAHHACGLQPRRHFALVARNGRSATRACDTPTAAPAAAQVLVHERPDRLVVTFMRMAARGAAAGAPRSTFQAELFTAAGHFQPAGAVRLTWLGVGAAAGLVGASAGGAAAADVADFGAAVRSTALSMRA